MTKLLHIFDRDTIRHLRITFSLFLFPIFCFAISQAVVIHWGYAVVIFIVLHFFIYPGSNGYNSYMDRDTGSIGGLEKPPPVSRNLYHASMICDLTGLLLCLLVGVKLLLLMVLYIIVSKAYSWHGIRLKKYAILGWLVVVLFQGAYTYMMVNMCCEDRFDRAWFTQQTIDCMAISTLLLGGFYPLTQVYQHHEDNMRGDYTISYRLGIRGTFVFSAMLFSVACGIAYYYFITYYTPGHFYLFVACLLPMSLYFLYWVGRGMGATPRWQTIAMPCV